MQEQLRKRDIVARKAVGERRQPRGIVIERFTISEQDMEWLGFTPIELGKYAVVMWHARMNARAERADQLEKVGALPGNEWATMASAAALDGWHCQVNRTIVANESPVKITFGSLTPPGPVFALACTRTSVSPDTAPRCEASQSRSCAGSCAASARTSVSDGS